MWENGPLGKFLFRWENESPISKKKVALVELTVKISEEKVKKKQRSPSMNYRFSVPQ